MILKTKKLKAITLVEQLLYLGLFGLIFVVIIEFSIDVTNNNIAARYRNHLERSNVFVYEHFEDSFFKASTIDINNSTFVNNNGKIRLLNSAIYYEYRIQNGRLIFSNNGVENYITPPDIVLDKLYFTQVYAPDDSLIGSKVEIIFRNSKQNNITKNFETLFEL